MKMFPLGLGRGLASIITHSFSFMGIRAMISPTPPLTCNPIIAQVWPEAPPALRHRRLLGEGHFGLKK